MKDEVGSGSWYANISFGDYSEQMTFEEFRVHCYEKCKERFLNSGVRKGDLIRVTYIGGYKPRKYTGIVTGIYGDATMGYSVRLQQKNSEKFVALHFVNDIEIIEEMSNFV